MKKEMDRMVEENIHYYSLEPENVIQDRMNALDREWDKERMIELNVSLISFAGIILSAAANKKWLFLPALAAAFLASRSIKGANSPLPIFNKLRTRRQIENEKFGLMEVIKNKDRNRYGDPRK